MSLFDDASLVLIPDGAKDGTLYSVKPTDGTGDFTFTRGSNLAATRVDEDGLIEKGRENLLLQSNQFDTTWTLTSNISVSGGQSGYDGSNDAWLLERNDTSARRIQQTITQSGVQTYSVYAKAESVNWMFLFAFDGTNSYDAYFDLANGVVGTKTNLIDAEIESVANGFYRCSITYNASTTFVRIYPAASDGSITGSISPAAIYIQDAQLEAGLVATDYIETGATTAQAGILEDLPRIDYSGGASCPALLLEPQRTNVAVSSEIFGAGTGSSIVLNNTASPDGYINADKLVEDTSTGVHRTIIGGSLGGSVDSSTYAISIFAKAAGRTRIQIFDNNQVSAGITSFDIENGVVISGTGKIEDYGNGWYRCIIFPAKTDNTTSNCHIRLIDSGTNVTYTGDGTSGVFLWGKQIEAGSYPTSYIPTYGSSVTRSADGLSISDIQTNNLIGSNQGSFVFHYKTYNAYTGNAGEIYDFRIDSNNRMATYFSNGTLRLFSNIAGVTNFNQATTLDGDTEFKIGVAYDTNSTLVYINGALSYTLNSFDLGVTNFDIAPPADGLKIGDFSWFPTKLTATELAALTTL